MSYDEMRHFADSWGLVFMGLVFLTFIAWTFRPGANRHHEDAANMIFDDSHEEGGKDD
ncbi:cbb3-type cytochrome c oxidase subunit 3 [Parasphingorhabdus sp. JC815]|uniref:cbb3-type cytochrome c oxidase subunit 3 n=1 Tax=Parasphingorhabdus sp. JC815 TaxID=3232140 RepID=UPI0034593B2A